MNLRSLRGLLAPSAIQRLLAISALFCHASPATARPVAVKVAEFKDQYVVSALTFNGDGSRLAVNFVVEGTEIHVWTWRNPSNVDQRLVKPGGAGDGSSLTYSPDGALLAVRHSVTSDGRVIRIWNAHTGAVVHDINGPDKNTNGADLAFSPDGKLLVRAMWLNRPGDQVIAYKTDTWDMAWKLNTEPFQPQVVAISPDGTLAAFGGVVFTTGTQDHPALQTHPRILIVSLIAKSVVRDIEEAFPDGGEVISIAWSPDGRRIAAGYTVVDQTTGPDAIRIFDPTSGNRLSGVPAKLATVSGLGYSPDGRFLIAGSIDGNVLILDAQNLRLLQAVPVTEVGNGSPIAVSRDGRYFALASIRTVSIWELN